MTAARLEHANVTVEDPKKTAEILCTLFDWKVRWEGPAKNNGYTVHVGEDFSYIALYAVGATGRLGDGSYVTVGGLNHIAVVVDDIDATERRILDAGYKTENHADYAPGRRFYFHDTDGIEYEVVSYAKARMRVSGASRFHRLLNCILAAVTFAKPL
ncbi:MAG: VOC family protein [Pseudomonadota bacterium]